MNNIISFIGSIVIILFIVDIVVFVYKIKKFTLENNARLMFIKSKFYLAFIVFNVLLIIAGIIFLAILRDSNGILFLLAMVGGFSFLLESSIISMGDKSMFVWSKDIEYKDIEKIENNIVSIEFIGTFRRKKFYIFGNEKKLKVIENKIKSSQFNAQDSNKDLNYP